MSPFTPYVIIVSLTEDPDMPVGLYPFTSMLQKFRKSQIRGVQGEAV
jgi:hypothetical protein